MTPPPLHTPPHLRLQQAWKHGDASVLRFSFGGGTDGRRDAADGEGESGIKRVVSSYAAPAGPAPMMQRWKQLPPGPVPPHQYLPSAHTPPPLSDGCHGSRAPRLSIIHAVQQAVSREPVCWPANSRQTGCADPGDPQVEKNSCAPIGPCSFSQHRPSLLALPLASCFFGPGHQ